MSIEQAPQKTAPRDSTGFLDDFTTLSEFGHTPGGGVDRQAASEADHATRAWWAEWLTGNGFKVVTDSIGNMFGLLEFVRGAPYVLLGSHLDSQPLAGRFDGAYGVLSAGHAAREVARRVAAGEVEPKLNIAVVNWFNEEGSRFAPSMMGSAVATGKLALETALAVRDHAGVSVAEALQPVDTRPEQVRVATYGEIHIEQGRILENKGITIGLVDRTWAASKYKIRVHGAQAHTGATVMADRRDALFGAALLITAARELTEVLPDGMLHSSVSEMEVLPNSPVTIARLVEMNLDLRSPDEDVLAEANRLLDERFAEIEQRARVQIERELTHHWGLLAYQPEGVELSRDTASALGLSHTEIMTVAGHDSTNMKDVVPSVMLFVPSIEGISHNEAENTEASDSVAGVTMLTDVAARMVGGELWDGQSEYLLGPAKG
ncbi:M20 family metallo-hydrolase [Ruicaihuangia caeni]|uniref:M20 family metallo-hydrolase n=1 Tax=Ruicaihuangia caeni TaxID=3042517 RepID=A0AAW6TB18_9MICO|nr:M20 family metallo-hydrolase [Klugiella sp. YN-L-19]MDI2099173.1 M20 family metallo-hydrolase [Klugiella sp. YN-L-19]